MANVQLAKNLKILRKKHNYTQQDLSDILNITRQAYSHYEQALREPDLNTLVHLSHLYKVSLDEKKRMDKIAVFFRADTV